MKRIRNRQLTFSRTLLLVVGLILLGGAILVGLLATKIVDRYGEALDAHTAILNDHGYRLLKDHELLFQIGAVLVGAVLVTVGIVWLTNQIPPHRHHEDHVFDNPDPAIAGRNTVAGDALAHALEADLERSPAVERARVEFRTDADLVRLRLDVAEDVAVEDIMANVVTPAIDRITTVAELPARPQLQADLRPVGATRRLQ
jgi:hypothetical protein